MNYRVLLSAPGWEIRLLGDGSEVKISSIADDLLLSSAEFNALALHAPIVRRMVDALTPGWELDNGFVSAPGDYMYCAWCGAWWHPIHGKSKNPEHENNCLRQQLLADIAELEKE